MSLDLIHIRFIFYSRQHHPGAHQSGRFI